MGNVLCMRLQFADNLSDYWDDATDAKVLGTSEVLIPILYAGQLGFWAVPYSKSH